MKDNHNDSRDYLRDLADIRSMMERSSRFMSLSGWAGILAGVYALAGAWLARDVFGFNPTRLVYTASDGSGMTEAVPGILLLGLAVLILAIGTAIVLSSGNAGRKGEKTWNPASRQLVIHMAAPLAAGGALVLILISGGVLGLVPPLTLLFYGLALFHASRFTFNDVKYLGIIQIVLGLAGAWFIEYGLAIWAFGFGIVHIVYGTYMYFRYER